MKTHQADKFQIDNILTTVSTLNTFNSVSFFSKLNTKLSYRSFKFPPSHQQPIDRFPEASFVQEVGIAQTGFKERVGHLHDFGLAKNTVATRGRSRPTRKSGRDRGLRSRSGRDFFSFYYSHRKESYTNRSNRPIGLKIYQHTQIEQGFQNCYKTLESERVIF